MKVLMVCLGNICRSPIAEGIMKKMLEEKGLDWEVDSAGTGSWHIGERPDPRSITIASKNGIDISAQRARKFHPADLDRFDLILAMDSSNFRDILRHARHKNQKDKVKMILNVANPGSNRSVPDPYWDDDGFEKVFCMLNDACGKVIERYSI